MISNECRAMFIVEGRAVRLSFRPDDGTLRFFPGFKAARVNTSLGLLDAKKAKGTSQQELEQGRWS